MRIVVAHEWLTNWAGSERVAYQMVRVTRSEEFVASIVVPEVARRHLPGVQVRALWPSRLAGARTHWSRYGPVMIPAWAATRIRGDALLVSSHFAAHGATLQFDGPSIVYYHTPARILWRPDMELDRLPPRMRGVVDRLALPPLRQWDRYVGQHPTVAVANSTAVADRIRRAYGRTATVLHPPVDVERWLTVERREAQHLVYLGRLVAYKKPWIAVETARRTGLPLVVIGDGPERARLERDAPPNVRFLGHATEDEVREALAHAVAFLFPGEEDFGIAPVEALAAGVPVVAYATGGALDFVRHGENGMLVSVQDPAAFADAVRELGTMQWDQARVRAGVEAFSASAFARGLGELLSGCLGSAWMR